MYNVFKIIAVTATIYASMGVSAAYAACTNPTAGESTMFYNTTVNAVQFCNGSNWVNTGIVTPSASGSSCSGPSGPEGSMFYNTNQNTVQFCNGDNWVNMGTMRFPSAVGTACTNPVADESSVIYNTSVGKVQFCNGDNWANATYLTEGEASAVPAGYNFLDLPKIVASDGAAGDQFGSNIAMDGRYLIVGADAADIGGVTNSGTVYVYDVFTKQLLRKLNSDVLENNSHFGYALDISGKYAIVGAYAEDDAGGANSGVAYIFDVTTGDQVHKLVASDAGAGDNFGFSVAIDGNTAVVGAKNENTNGGSAGAAYVFNVASGLEIHKLLGSDTTTGDLFGGAVDISGNRVVVGAESQDILAGNGGAIYVFDAIAGGSQLYKKAGSVSGGGLGSVVSINNDYVAAGSKTEKAVYVYNTTDGVQQKKLTSVTATFGTSIALSGDYLAVGMSGYNNGKGTAYVYDLSTASLVKIHMQNGYDSVNDDVYGYGLALTDGYLAVGAHGDDDKGSGSGSAYLYD